MFWQVYRFWFESAKREDEKGAEEVDGIPPPPPAFVSSFLFCNKPAGRVFLLCLCTPLLSLPLFFSPLLLSFLSCLFPLLFSDTFSALCKHHHPPFLLLLFFPFVSFGYWFFLRRDDEYVSGEEGKAKGMERERDTVSLFFFFP